jgi:hypothetical protein
MGIAICASLLALPQLTSRCVTHSHPAQQELVYFV